MTWWVLEERDTYLRDGAQSCHLEYLKPVRSEASAAVCPKCGSKLEPDVWLPPRRARVSGTLCGDLIQGAGFELVISTRSEEVFRAEGLKGFASVGPVELEPPQSTPFVAARPRVTVTRLDEEGSGLKWRRAPTCDLCRLGVRESVKRVVLDESTWDGSDIFVASGFYGVKLVTKRFVDCVQEHGLTNFRFIPGEDYSDKLGRLPPEFSEGGSR